MIVSVLDNFLTHSYFQWKQTFHMKNIWMWGRKQEEKKTYSRVVFFENVKYLPWANNRSIFKVFILDLRRIWNWRKNNLFKWDKMVGLRIEIVHFFRSDRYWSMGLTTLFTEKDIYNYLEIFSIHFVFCWFFTTTRFSSKHVMRNCDRFFFL